MKRVRGLQVSSEVFVDMLLTIQKGEWIGIEGIPEDLRILGCQWNFAMNCFEILVESQEFEEVPPNAVAPYWTPTMHKYSTAEWARKDPDPPSEIAYPILRVPKNPPEPETWIKVNPRYGIKPVGPLEKIVDPFEPEGRNHPTTRDSMG